MRYDTPYSFFSFAFFLSILLTIGCNRDTSERDTSHVITGKATESPAQSRPPQEEPPTINETSVAAPEIKPQPGVLLGKADFWLGQPNQTGSMIYLRLSADTEIKVLGQIKDYYRVMHRGLIGYVEKDAVDMQEPTGSASIASSDSPGGNTSAPTPPPAPESPESTEAPSTTPAVTPCTGGNRGELFPGVSCELYMAKVQEKVSTLETYIKRIIDKTEINRQKSIDLACRLFVNEQARVYTSSLNEEGRSRPIRKYLNSLMTLSYDKVEIEWTNIQYVSELRKGPDDRYYGFVHIEQQFAGFIDGRLVYGDVTEKKITIVLETYEIVTAQGESSKRWDIFLSDIGVEQTKMIE